MLRRVLIAYTSRPPTIDYLRGAFARRGIEVEALLADQNTWFDRFIIRRLNKLAHNFRIIPKSMNFFEDHPLSHMNFRSAQLRSAITRYDPDLLFLIRGLGFRSWAVAGARTKFSWWVEADERVDEALCEVPEFDRYFFINSSSVEVARRAGYSHTSYLAHAVDASVFRPLAGVAKDIDFFFGRIVVAKTAALHRSRTRRVGKPRGIRAQVVPKDFPRPPLQAHCERPLPCRRAIGAALQPLENRHQRHRVGGGRR